MKRQRVGELELSSFCLSATAFGAGLRGDAMFRLYDDFREAGGDFFDTAHCYCFWLEDGAGSSERALGECLRRNGDGGKVFIGTKGGHPAVPPKYPRPDAFLAPEVLASDIQESQDRLGVERIDLYFLHRDDPRVPVSEILSVLNAEADRGRIRCLGASNWSTRRIEEANVYAARHGLRGFVASQPQWSLALPNASGDPTMKSVTPEDEAWHARHQLPVVAYSPTACGYFAREDLSACRAFDSPASRARHHRAHRLAAELGATPNQIALAWLMSQPFPVIPILGATKRGHLADALGAASVQLSTAQRIWLRDG